MEQSVFLEAALKYLARGFSVIPIKPDKKPYIRWEPCQRHRSTEEEVREWWRKWPSAIVGVVTGTISNISVIDIDEDQGHEEISKYLPDSLLMPTVQTPSGGQHLYFQASSPPIGNNTRIIPGCDFRGEGGYVVAPPSVNGTGKTYSWMPGLSVDEVPPPELPGAYINKIINSNGYMRSSNSNDHNGPPKTTKTTEMFVEGRRDEDLFHTANIMVKGGGTENEISQVLKILAKSCTPPFPEQEIFAKIESALKRSEASERSLTNEIREWVLTTSDHIMTTDVHKELQLTTRREMKTCYMVLQRLRQEGILEKFGTRRGSYRRVDTQVEAVDFLNAPTNEFPIEWPLGVQQLSIIYPGNIIIIAGSKSAGKTAFLLNTVRLNQDKHEIIYLNSEMGDAEFRKRLELFQGMPLSSWKVKAYHRNSNFADLITGEKKIFIVDFLEVTTDFWKVAQYIQEIHRKLKDGIAIIAIQKSDSKEHGRGGDFSKEKARLYLALDYLPDRKINRIKIVDAKAWRTEKNPRGMFRHYKLVGGAKFVSDDNWLE